MDQFNTTEQIDNWQLKNRAIQRYSASNSISYSITTLSYTRMYIRTQFSINISIQGVQPYLVSRFKPNIFQSTVSIKANGILNGQNKSAIQWEEFYTPAVKQMRNFIENIFNPKEILLLSSQAGVDDDEFNTTYIVNDEYKHKKTQYPNTSLSHSNNYKIYYPQARRIENCLIGFQVSAQDKVYNLTKTLISMEGIS